MHFTRLRLSGFKSFVEPTEFVIQPGLTGVVGPNGCGKSNLVEALRWVMGENSPKKMRGSAMDDVIFAGTATRPSRNLAEVALILDNVGRKAPAAFNEAEQLEIVRRIERESGSNYRINGKEVRARDVQLLFADIASGAHSTALVSQGRVGTIINAKPTERRVLLEEAAGITGLHSRRHEAELRLRAAEQNLERVDDVVGQLDQQLQGLKRQARQANRYRNLSGHIRRAEAILYHLRYTQSTKALEEAKRLLNETTTVVADLTTKAAQAQNAETQAGETLPPLRQSEAEAAAKLHRLAVARDGLDAEERRAQEAKAQLEARLKQNEADESREKTQARDAVDAVNRLDAEAAEIAETRAGEADTQAQADAEVNRHLFAVGERQAELDALTERAASEQATRQRLTRAIADAEQRIQRLQGKLADLARERERFAAEDDAFAVSESAAAEVERAQTTAIAAREALEAAETARVEAQTAESGAREAKQKLDGEAAKINAEITGLARLLAIDENNLWPPLIDAVSVAPGYEKALGAALGEDLSVAADIAAPAHWDVLPPYADPAPLPEGCTPLSQFVTAPPPLARRLSQIGVVDESRGAELRRELRQGQRLVSRAGALWRWDGYTAKAGAQTAAGARLEQRNRLNERREELARLKDQVAEADAAFAAARAAAQRAGEAETDTRGKSRAAESALNLARDVQAAAVRKAAERASRLAALTESEEQAQRDLNDSEARQAEDANALAALPPEAEAKELIGNLRQELESLRQQLAEARATLEGLRRDAAQRTRRAEAIIFERRGWTHRAAGAAGQLEQLAARRAQAEAELAEVAKLPDEIAERRRALQEQIVVAEAERTKAADTLAEAEATLNQLVRFAKETRTELAQAREDRVRREADAEHADAVLQDLAQRIREALDCAPADALAAGDVAPDEELPELAAIEMKLDRLKKERDNMGPVNLRAEIEAQEVDDRLTMLQNERADLVAAIERLRQGISSLNKEGRERLLAAFKQVDEHFQKLFTRVFGGGRAHLALTESDDPLEAGLEIMASPPGKKLQVMSLLSGGEQALTALSLLFAVFLTNPAPLCVLDEVDAPLDDANVERLCDLLDEMARGSDTRFLVVTHHPITMARMDRLFGVTMAERGVSTLVSVDLNGVGELKAA